MRAKNIQRKYEKNVLNRGQRSKTFIHLRWSLLKTNWEKQKKVKAREYESSPVFLWRTTSSKTKMYWRIRGNCFLQNKFPKNYGVNWLVNILRLGDWPSKGLVRLGRKFIVQTLSELFSWWEINFRSQCIHDKQQLTKRWCTGYEKEKWKRGRKDRGREGNSVMREVKGPWLRQQKPDAGRFVLHRITSWWGYHL